MNPAEHSSLDHSAPQGAAAAAAAAASSHPVVCSPISSGAPSASPSDASSDSPSISQPDRFAFRFASTNQRPTLMQLTRRRFTSSGRTLIAVLALGVVFSPTNRAGAVPPQAGTLGKGTGKTWSNRAFSTQLPRANTAISASREALRPAHRAVAMPRLASIGASPLASPLASAWVSGAASGRKSLLNTTFPTARAANSTRPASQATLQWAQFRPSPSQVAELFPAQPAGIATQFGGMKKVISVPSLSLPPLSKPLPSWMQNAAVRIDGVARGNAKSTSKKAPLRLAQNPFGQRLAQNPAAPPVRNPGAPVTNSDRLPNQIEVGVSTFVVLLTTTDLQTVAVADPSIADVAVVNSRSVLLNGKAAGVTSLVIVDGQKIRQYTVRVTAAPGSRPVDIASAIGLAGVTVRPLKDALVLEGEVASAEEARRATEIATIYAPKVVNQLSIRGQVSQEAGAAAQLRDLINLPNINVRVSGDTAILSGTVDSPQQIQEADTIARTAAKNVINLLRLPVLSLDQLRESLGAGSGVVAGADNGAGNSGIIGSATNGPLLPGTFAAPSPLTIRQAGGSLVLEGTVTSPGALDQILGQAARTGLPILNRLQLPASASPDQGLISAVAAAIGRPTVRVSGTAKRLVLEGLVPDTEAAVAVEQIARAYATQVDNLLQTPNPRLVDVDVSIVEITKTGLKNLGFTFPSLLDSNNSGFVLGQRSVLNDLPGSLTPGTVVPNSIRGAFTQQTALQAALRAEITNQNVRLLSNPHTTVLSGRTATFQVGGQVPVPISITQSATGTITGISFKDFGVLVDVVPNASANGAITMRIKTEISQPDPSIGFTPFAGASVIPGFQRRAAETEVTTPVGGTVALGGLISNTNRQLITKLPLLGNLPILGSLFTSKRYQNDQSELVIFVTPRLLPNPLAPGDTAAAGVVAVGNTSNIGTVLGNPGLSTGGVSTTAAAGP